MVDWFFDWLPGIIAGSMVISAIPAYFKESETYLIVGFLAPFIVGVLVVIYKF